MERLLPGQILEEQILSPASRNAPLSGTVLLATLTVFVLSPESGFAKLAAQ
jgi:hypothetical protein